MSTTIAWTPIAASTIERMRADITRMITRERTAAQVCAHPVGDRQKIADRGRNTMAGNERRTRRVLRPHRPRQAGAGALMSTPTVRIPATDQVDHRARAYDATQALADLTKHLDQHLPVSLEISAGSGSLGVLLHDPATRRHAEWLAHRLGLTEDTDTAVHSGDWVMRTWTGDFGGFPTLVTWFDKPGADL